MIFKKVKTQNSSLSTVLYFIIIYAFEDIPIHCIYMVEVLHNDKLLLSFQLHF